MGVDDPLGEQVVVRVHGADPAALGELADYELLDFGRNAQTHVLDRVIAVNSYKVTPKPPGWTDRPPQAAQREATEGLASPVELPGPAPSERTGIRRESTVLDSIFLTGRYPRML